MRSKEKSPAFVLGYNLLFSTRYKLALVGASFFGIVEFTLFTAPFQNATIATDTIFNLDLVFVQNPLFIILDYRTFESLTVLGTMILTLTSCVFIQLTFC